MDDLYIVIHTHRHGISTYLVRCDRQPSHDEVIYACDIDFEDDRDDEFLEVTPAGDITHIE